MFRAFSCYLWKYTLPRWRYNCFFKFKGFKQSIQVSLHLLSSRASYIKHTWIQITTATTR
ncbi:hypothetical protein GBAR_LOCUS2954 [Geodia barretti]|uniref:Uncharacterized protein n=1 Tax=Geodia barretti TaxID=519541 RepID=A0AA35W003_GEOBA|nr:hypothetical protein GBAR_LOCUS2954 [Geodia barretti]